MAEPREHDCIEERPPLVAMLAPPVGLAIGAACFALGMPAFLALAAMAPPVVFPVLFSTREARVEAGDAGLAIDGRLRLRRADIGDVWFEDDARFGTRVHVQQAGRRDARTFRFASRVDARRFVSRLGGSGRATRSESQAVPHVVLACAAIAVILLAPALVSERTTLGYSVLAVLCAALVAGGISRTVTVGTDGFEIVGAGRRRFVAYEDVVSIAPNGLVELADGGRLRLGPAIAKSAAPLVGRVVARVDRAVRELDDEAPSPSLATRIETLAATGEAVTSYRSAALEASELWALVQSGRTPPGLRVRAVDLLLADDPARANAARLAELLRTTASTELREALDARLGDDPLRLGA